MGDTENNADESVYKKAGDDPAAAQDSLIGPPYDYSGQIKVPAEMGMSAAGDDLANNVGGLINYTKLLVEGGGKASRVNTPLGNKYFLQSGAQCKDGNGNVQKRSIYINHQADGSMPFMSSGTGFTFGSFKGLIPGLMSNIAQINPFQIVGAFTAGARPACQKIRMSVLKGKRNATGVVTYEASEESAYVANVDIKGMNACWFPDQTNPITRRKCIQAFTNMNGKSLQGHGQDKKSLQGRDKKSLQQANEIQLQKFQIAQMPEDIIVRVYYMALGVLGLYILFRLFQRKQSV